MTDNLGLVRQLWHVLEPVHATLYYAPEATDEASRLGYAVQTRWPSYFAYRGAPLGPVAAAELSDRFYSFNPDMIAQYVPAIWSVAKPEQVLAARLEAIDRGLRTLIGDVATPELAEAASLARRAAESADTTNRPLAAANAELPWPDLPHLALWQAATILREHRGDGHIAALVEAGLDPTEALVSLAALGTVPVEVFASRGWTDEQWQAAADRLAARGWIDESGMATDRGRAGREAVERRTDELASQPWRVLGPASGRLAQLVVPIMMAVVQSGLLPRQSTLAITKPA